MKTMRDFINICEEAELTSLDEIEQEAESLGVFLSVSEYSDEIHLEYIERKNGTPKGAGAHVMQLLCDYADDTDKSIYLQVDHGKEALIDYYGKFDFVGGTGGYEDGEDIPMRRQPY